MKLRIFLVMLCLGFGVTVNAQTVSDNSGVEMTAGQDAFHAQLELRTDVIEIRRCSDDSLRFILRLNFSNKGNGPVILDKRSSVISKYMISRSSEDATRKKYEIEVPRLVGLEAAGMTLESVPDESQFVVLKPGELFSLNRVFNFHIRLDPDDKAFLLANNRVLQLVLLTWYYPRASNVKWRDRWQTKGYLWSDPITSLPMPFMVERKPPVVDCH